MAVGKNKRLQKKGKGGKKKKIDAFEKKKWFRLKMPRLHSIKVKNYGWICANKTAQGVHVEDRLYNRVCTIRCGDLEEKPVADSAETLSTATNLKLRIAKTENDECWLDFHGFELTRDKTCSLLKKWVTLVEAHTDIITTDGYKFRVFGMALTKKQEGQCKKTSYAKTSQIKRLRARMIEIMNNELGEKGTKEFVNRALVNKCGEAFKKDLGFIFPIKDACVRKVKLIKRPPKEDLRYISELHDVNKDAGDMDE